ncbi:transient receptor potential cation channel subfamily V member 1-like [Chanos chanos]|uniref:Transient receptor potential cation channel subfamily V member 1-like n=1 Tax=Chanos chanos TaxID=29144 RepID=A0A6J2WWW1_CHACN|nr:transient receptor potential cation channel subfamily V member 1-like [Chanos chanos]
MCDSKTSTPKPVSLEVADSAKEEKAKEEQVKKSHPKTDLASRDTPNATQPMDLNAASDSKTITAKSLSVEVDDGTKEEKREDKEVKKTSLKAGLGLGSTDKAKQPVDQNTSSNSKTVTTKCFSLEVDDRTDEERTKDKQAAKNRPKTDKAKPPMDTNYEQERIASKPQIRLNLNFDKGIRGIKVDMKQRAMERFDGDRLFKAVVSGDRRQLEGLEKHLKDTGKRLSDSLYTMGGKSALLKALLNLKDGKNEAVEHLLDISERQGDLDKFVNAKHTEDQYAGQTALHVAIEKRSLHYVKLLVQKGANVHALANGMFFKQKKEASFYFGELPLSLAACTNQEKVVDFLIENKADAGQQDSYGNTVLHALVVLADDSPENTEFVVRMYDHILIKTAELHPKIRLEDIKNKQGLTPIKLAANTGKLGLFEHMLRREPQDEKSIHLSRKFTEWSYGPVYSSLYDLASLDTYEKNSVLEIIVYGSKIPNRQEMLQVEPLNRLLEDKWERFARHLFLISFAFYALYLCIFTTTAYWHKEGRSSFPLVLTKGGLHLTGQVISALGAVYFFVKGLTDMRRKPPKLQNLLIDGYSELLFFLQAILFVAYVVLYVCGREEYLGFMVLCLALSWINLLYYSRGFKHMGIYSVMIQRIILGDILRFLLVYIVFLVGFSAAVVTLVDEPPDQNNTDLIKNLTSKSNTTLPVPTSDSEETDQDKPKFQNIYLASLELFKFTIGMGDLEFTENYKHTKVFFIVLILYIVLTYILLLNMLIALMNKTVDRLYDESTNIWKLQRAITILDMERCLSQHFRKKLRSGVEIDLQKNGEDCRRCLRVEEVSWEKWNSNLCIHEDPGNFAKPSTTDTKPERDEEESQRSAVSSPILDGED